MNGLKHFWTFLAVMAIHIFFLPSQTKGASIITATITVTNTPGVGTNWIVNGNSRTWTNNAGTPPGSWIQVTNGAGPTASNLYNSIVRFPYFSPFLSVSRTGTNTFTLRGTTLVITTNNYFSVSYQTNTGTNLTVVQVPFENVPGTTNWTNNAHWLVDALNRYPYTNAFATNANVVSNALIKGASPYQEILGPVGFWGRFAVLSNFFATNGFTRNLTNINPISSNGVNFGNAFRSEGAGGNSLQIGSNATATGLRSITIGNNSTNSGQDGAVIGNNATNSAQAGTVLGNLAMVNGVAGTAAGYGAVATNLGSAFGALSSAAYLATAAGRAAAASGQSSAAFGDSSEASGYNAGAFQGAATAPFSRAFGGLAGHSNSVAIGTDDHLGNSTTTTATNQIRIGTSNHRISAPGLYESPAATNSQFAGTNIARGSWSYPRFDLSTLANGNNISVPFGTNHFVRLSGTVSASPTICGIIGAATSGGLDGQEIIVHNDCGFTAIFAQNTVDPVAANRIETTDGSDVNVLNNGWAILEYSGSDARWHVTVTYPLTASATNGFLPNWALFNTNVISTTASNAAIALNLWTNTGSSVSLVGQPIALRIFPSNTTSGANLEIGGKSGDWLKNSYGDSLFDYSLVNVRVVESGDNKRNRWVLGSGQDNNANRYSLMFFIVETNFAYITSEISGGPGSGSSFFIGYDGTASKLQIRTNNSPAFIVDGAGNIFGASNGTNAGRWDATTGFASYSIIATNQIPTTGWTNNAAINVTVYTTATAVSFTINNRAGTVLYTSPVLTATMPINLQPGWSVRAASGLTGTVLPF